MYEVEIKLRADHAALRDALADADAERVDRIEQTDTYYDAPHRSFAETDEALRVRRTADPGGSGPGSADDADDAHLTYKGPLVETESKTREEFETRVGDAGTAAAILDGLGFAPAATVEKERERYRLDGTTVTLDAVAGLGEFVEAEREAEKDDVERVREQVRDTVRALGLDPDDQIRTSYLGLLLESDE